MQPYFLPYIGYFQLINMVDEFVVYDAIEFTKKGWVHRNRMLQNGDAVFFTLPLKKDSDYLDVNERYLVIDFENEASKMLRKIEANYRKAPFFKDFFPIVESIFKFDSKNLFVYIHNSILTINDYLGITTPVLVSSRLGDKFKDLKSQDKVLEICQRLNAKVYINSIGGIELYDKEVFAQKEIQLNFYKTNDIIYPQFQNSFVPYLSILDVCMFNDKEIVTSFLAKFDVL